MVVTLGQECYIYISYHVGISFPVNVLLQENSLSTSFLIYAAPFTGLQCVDALKKSGRNSV